MPGVSVCSQLLEWKVVLFLCTRLELSVDKEAEELQVCVCRYQQDEHIVSLSVDQHEQQYTPIAWREANAYPTPSDGRSLLLLTFCFWTGRTLRIVNTLVGRAAPDAFEVFGYTFVCRDNIEQSCRLTTFSV